MPEDLAAVSEALGERLLSARPLGGGCVGEVYRAELADGSVVVAKLDRSQNSYLEREAFMLRYLREQTELPVPEVFHATEELLVMEFLPGGSVTAAAEPHAAELLAGLHKLSGEGFGFEQDTVIGGLDQPNPLSEKWVAFFRDHRLLHMANVACGAGRLPDQTLRRIEKLAERLDCWLIEPEQPLLIHGNVWGGNVLAEGKRVTGFLDPAIYRADPEVELACITLFNTFGNNFFRRYAEIRDIRDGILEERRHLYNLYPLLVHVRLFGGGYLSSVEEKLKLFGV